MEELIKIQINHENNISKNELATILYEQVGEENRLTIEDIEYYFEFKYINLLPNGSFISIVEFSLPELETRDVTLKDIVFSFLNSIKLINGVTSLTKLNDSILQNQAVEYYKKIIDLEMDMRNVLTYILVYNEKRISDELFKSFGINKSEKVNHEEIKNLFENGLFYIYFNHYASFEEAEKLKLEQISDFLQSPSIDTFEKFKEKLQDRGLTEERHVDFIASIKTKLKPIESMRNAIMHIRNLSDSMIRNFDKAINDFQGDKGVKSLIDDFWNNENEILKQNTFMKIIENEIIKIFSISRKEEDKLIIEEDISDEILSEYEDIESFNDDFISFTDSFLIDYELQEEDELIINEMILTKWQTL